MEAIKLETLNITDKDFFLLDVKLWLENLLHDHSTCEVRPQSYAQNVHPSPQADIYIAHAYSYHEFTCKKILEVESW